MRVKKTIKVVKEVEETVEDYLVCDKTGLMITKQAYEHYVFEFNIEMGSSYPECGNYTEYKLHLDQTCIPDLIKLLRDNGYKVQEREVDW